MIRLFLLIAIFLSSFFSVSFAQTRIEKHYFNGEYEEALKLLDEKIASGKAVANDFIFASNCNLQQFNYEGAIQTYEKGLQSYPNNTRLIEGLADAQLNMGFKTEALKSYSLLVQLDSTNVRYLGKQAGVMMDLDLYAKAKKIYQSLFDADSSNIYFLRKLMMARYKMKEYAYTINLKIKNPYFPQANKELQLLVADCYLKINRNFDAVSLLDSILRIDSLYIPAISKLAFVQFGTFRNYEDAVVLYRRLNALEGSTDLGHLKNVAICEYFVGNQEIAAPILEALIKELPDDPFVPFYAGLSYKKLGDVDKALEYIEKAGGMVIPDYAGDVFHHLGRAYAAKRMFQEAIDTYQKVRLYDPQNYQVLFDIAVCHEEWKLNRTVALGYYQQYVKECTKRSSSDFEYAENRIRFIKEELFFEGE